MGLTYIQLFYDTIDACVELNDAQFGRLIRALLLYADTGVPPVLKGQERHYLARYMQDIDRNKAAYEDRCRKSREAARMRWHTDAYQDKDKNEDKDKDDTRYARNGRAGKKRRLKNNSQITIAPEDLFVPFGGEDMTEES